jgi:hypothetical protein
MKKIILLGVLLSLATFFIGCEKTKYTNPRHSGSTFIQGGNI